MLDIQDIWPVKLKKIQNKFEDQRKTRGGKTQIFIILSPFYD